MILRNLIFTHRNTSYAPIHAVIMVIKKTAVKIYIFGPMKNLIICSCFFSFSFCLSQDKIFFLDGSAITGKVLEVGPETVKINSNADRTIIYKNEILLIEYKNGSIDYFTAPPENKIYNTNEMEDPSVRKPQVLPAQQNFASINALAVANADISGFYEYITRTGSMGFGVMGAYNFNIHANLQNAFIFILTNGKKNYDLGAFANIYTSDLTDGKSFYYGILFKYTSLTFSGIRDTTTSVISYTTEKGSQLATIFTIGTHYSLPGSVFIKTMAGLGGFNMRGRYREEYNRINASNYYFRPKFYFGINIGFNF